MMFTQGGPSRPAAVSLSPPQPHLSIRVIVITKLRRDDRTAPMKKGIRFRNAGQPEPRVPRSRDKKGSDRTVRKWTETTERSGEIV